MIKLFRNIRQQLVMKNQTERAAHQSGRYLKYAIGEIILVVIGILIALQINNWNSEKTQNKNITSYALNLIDDLNGDIRQTELRIKRINKNITYIDSTAAYVRNHTIGDIKNIDALYEFNLFYGYRPFNWFTATIEEIKNSGSLKLIKNDSLRRKIINYYSFTAHLDEDFKSDEELANQLSLAQSQVLNTNYPKRQELLDSINFFYDKGRKAWKNSETYKNAAQLNMDLLTDDINDLHAIVNLLYQYKGQLNTRANTEFPRLIRNAEDIIQLIKTEYQ